MPIVRVMAVTSTLRLTATLSALVLGLLALPGFAAAQDRSEWRPGLDLWCCEPEPAPYWKPERLTPDLQPRAKRHHEFMQAGVPLEYRSRTSPYPAATKVIDEGGGLYRAHCAVCHGAKGLGDGEAGNDLRPSPALLAHLIERPRSVDEYLLWTISEGGAQFGTAMPAFEGTLTERQIWQIVVYMRAGFPPAGAQ